MENWHLPRDNGAIFVINWLALCFLHRPPPTYNTPPPTYSAAPAAKTRHATREARARATRDCPRCCWTPCFRVYYFLFTETYSRNGGEDGVHTFCNRSDRGRRHWISGDIYFGICRLNLQPLLTNNFNVRHFVGKYTCCEWVIPDFVSKNDKSLV